MKSNEMLRAKEKQKKEILLQSPIIGTQQAKSNRRIPLRDTHTHTLKERKKIR